MSAIIFESLSLQFAAGAGATARIVDVDDTLLMNLIMTRYCNDIAEPLRYVIYTYTSCKQYCSEHQ